MNEIVKSVLDDISSVVKSISPEDLEKIATKLSTDYSISMLDKSQAEIDVAEATTGSIFLAGWRPLVGWICAITFGLVYLVFPIVQWIHNIFVFHAYAAPVFDMAQFMTVLMGMLGLGLFRTIEKFGNVQDKH